MDKQTNKSEFWENLKAQKKWWLTPALIIAVLLILFLIFGKNPKIAPFIYERF